MDATLVKQSNPRRRGLRERFKAMAVKRDGYISITTVISVALPIAAAIWFMADMNATQRAHTNQLNYQQQFDLAMREDIMVITTYYQKMQVTLAEKGVKVESLPPLKTAIMNPLAPSDSQDQSKKP